MKKSIAVISLLLLVSNLVKAQIDFNYPVKTTIGSYIESVAIGDINSDGRNDAVAVTRFNSNPESDYTIFVFVQQPDGTLNQPLKYKYPAAYSNIPVVQVADVNNDSRNDVILSFGDSVGILYQNVSGNLNPLKSMFCGNDTGGMKTGDLNNDGLTDIAVVCHWNDMFIKVFYQKLSGGFQTETFPIQNHGNDELDINDMNGDGLNDLIFMPGQGMVSTIYIYYQHNPAGLSQTPSIYDFSHEVYKTFTGIGTGDLNNDGRNDLVGSMGGNEGHAWIAISYQQQDGTLGPANFIPSYDIPSPVEVADLNCDNKNEIIVGHQAWGSFSVWEQDINGNYSDYKLFGFLYYVGPYGMAVGDLNGDSRKDVFSTSGYSSVYFMYNTTAPQGTLPTDTLVVMTTINSDTTFTYKNTYNTSETTRVGGCLIKTDYELEKTNFYYYSETKGDSLFPRHFNFCAQIQADTLKHHFENSGYVSSSITDSTVLSVDTITENWSVYSTWITNDSIWNLQKYKETILLTHQYHYSGDTTYVTTDSLLLKQVYEMNYIKQTEYKIFAGMKCGNMVWDTTSFASTKADSTLLGSDTAFISRTENAYPYGIYENTRVSGISIYPNPTRDFSTLEFANSNSGTEVFMLRLFNAAGKQVWETKVPAQEKIKTIIDCKPFPSGIYTLMVLGNRCAGAVKLMILH